jgi:hypothetical protein
MQCAQIIPFEAKYSSGEIQTWITSNQKETEEVKVLLHYGEKERELLMIIRNCVNVKNLQELQGRSNKN